MRPLTFLIVLSLLLAGCGSAGSVPTPTVAAGNFPTLAPAVVTPCLPGDLKTSANSTGATGAILLGLTLINTSGKTCSLANPPQLSLAGADGAPVSAKVEQTAEMLTPPAPASIEMAPSSVKILTVVWRNFCGKLPSDQIILRINLEGGQTLDTAIDLQAFPRCDAAGEDASLSVAPFTDPP